MGHPINKDRPTVGLYAQIDRDLYFWIRDAAADRGQHIREFVADTFRELQSKAPAA